MARPMIFITGDKELDRQLKALGNAAVKKLFRKSTRLAAKKMQTAIKATIPVSNNKKFVGSRDKRGMPTVKKASSLKQEIKVRAMTRTRKGRIGHSVVIGGGAAVYVSKVELGTRYMQPKRTIRDAFNTNKNSVGSQFVNDVWDELRAEVART